MTTNLNRRLAEHNAGQSRYTRAHRPWKVIYTEELETRVKARSREKYLKSGEGRAFLDGLC